MNKALYKIFAVSLLTIGFSLFMQVKSADAATLTLSVNCSIDDAITNANNDDQSGSVNCTGGSGDDIIDVPTGTWSIGVDSIITESLSFVGTGAGSSVIDGSDTFQGLYCIDDDVSETLTVSELTVQNINLDVRAAIGAELCNLAIDSVEITGNQNATVFAASVYLENNGSPNSATLDINDLYIHDSLGTGIMYGGPDITATINRYSIGNMLQWDIGLNQVTAGILVLCDCGIGTDGPVSGITNSTIDNVGLGIVLNNKNSDSMNAIVQNTTITNTGGVSSPYPASSIILISTPGLGQSNYVTLEMINSLIAGHVQDACGSLNAGQGSTIFNFTSLGNNLSDDDTCSLNASGDQENVSNIISTLGAFQDNGGETPTRALLSGSPAINAGATVLGISTDQRGIARPQGSAYDVGSYEYNAVQTVGSGNDQVGAPNTGLKLEDNNLGTKLLLLASVVLLIYGIIVRRTKFSIK